MRHNVLSIPNFFITNKHQHTNTHHTTALRIILHPTPRRRPPHRSLCVIVLQTDGCPSGKVCCTCNCNADDTILSTFACACNAKGKALPASQQPTCCGGVHDFTAWCAKAGTASTTDPKCSDRTKEGIPIPKADFYEYSYGYRCVDRCGAGNCDNPYPRQQSGCAPSWMGLR